MHVRVSIPAYVQGQAWDLLCSPLAQSTALTGWRDPVMRRLSQSHADHSDQGCHVHVASLVPGTHAHGCSRNVDPAPHCDPDSGWRVLDTCARRKTKQRRYS
jgi:hypothetical protein